MTYGIKLRVRLKLCKDWIDKLRVGGKEKIVAVASFGHRLGGKMKKKTLLFSALLLVVLALEGCATIRGIGEDIQSLGRALKRAVSG
jgi:predicted small secreted protein